MFVCWFMGLVLLTINKCESYLECGQGSCASKTPIQTWKHTDSRDNRDIRMRETTGNKETRNFANNKPPYPGPSGT